MTSDAIDHALHLCRKMLQRVKEPDDMLDLIDLGATLETIREGMDADT